MTTTKFNWSNDLQFVADSIDCEAFTQIEPPPDVPGYRFRFVSGRDTPNEVVSGWFFVTERNMEGFIAYLQHFVQTEGHGSPQRTPGPLVQ